MSEIDVQKHVIERFIRLYGDPNTSDIEGFFAEYQKALRSYRADHIECAIDAVVKAHEHANWPTIGRVITALDKCVSTFIKSYRAPSPRPEPEVEYSAETRARVQTIVDDFKKVMSEKRL